MKEKIKNYCKRLWITWLRRSAAGLFVLLGLSILLFFLASNIQAAQIEKVQNASTFADDAITIILTDLTEAVDTTNSFILQYVEMGAVYQWDDKKGGQGGEAFGLFTTMFEEADVLNTGRLRADDIQYSMPANIENTVLEFNDGVNIYSGAATIASTIYQRDITLPQTIDRTKTFPVLMIKSGFLLSPSISNP